MLLDFLGKNCDEVILVKGNHDTILGPIADKRRVRVVDGVVVCSDGVIELIDDVKAFLKRKSKQICQICHSYVCPKCKKPILTKIRDISGENEYK